METGKSIAKSGKASVRNGSCQWEETILESTWISQDEASTDADEYLLKFVVAMVLWLYHIVISCEWDFFH